MDTLKDSTGNAETAIEGSSGGTIVNHRPAFDGGAITNGKLFPGVTTIRNSGLMAQTTTKPEYQTQIKSRVSVPLKGAGALGASLEMTTASEGEFVDFTLIQPGRQAIPFTLHRRDIEALMGELTLDKLSK